MPALYEVLKYLLYLEMGICVIYINEIMPERLSDTETLGPYRKHTTWRQHTQWTLPNNEITRAIMLLI